jgi:hypothetical protein
MGPATTHTITELERRPGRLEFRARVGGLDKRLFIRTETPVTPSADAALAACLMPAMVSGGTLTMTDPVSPRLLRTQREFAAIQQAWSEDWEFDQPPLHEVMVRSPVRAAAPREPTGRVAAFFSGGVDSWSTVLDNPDLTDLIFVRGIDLLPGLPDQAELAGEVERRLRETADALGLALHAVQTNARELADPLVPWEAYFACPLIAVALFFEPLFDRVLIAGDTDYATQDARGGNRLVCRLWSTEGLQVADDGGRFNRMERTARIAGHPVVQKSLRVCWENPGGAYNCGRCSKCLMTMASLEATGNREKFSTFPAELDLEELGRSEVFQAASLTLREDILDAAGEAGDRPALVSALEAVIAKGKRDLGIPPEHRQRPRPVTPASVVEPSEQEIADLHAGPGELSFEARIGGASKRIWFRTETEVTPSADAALAACLMPAMRSGGGLKMSDPVSPRLLRNQREFQAIQRAWSREWDFGDPPLREVEVSAPSRAVEPRQPTGRVAAFFSGGVDSWSTVLDNPDITDLIFVRGVDLLTGAPHQVGLADEVEARLREGAGLLGLQFHAVETNVRELSDPLVRWETYFACPLAAVALFFEPLFDRVLIAGDTDYATQPPLGASWTIDSLWSTERLEVVDDGGRYNRVERIRRIASHPVAHRTLRVCWENPGGAYNCGRCRKCLMAMVTLEAIGARESFPTFPPDLDLERVRNAEMTYSLVLLIWEDLLQEVRDVGRRDLVEAVEESVVRGRARLGLPPSHRYRHRPAVAVRTSAAVAAPPPALFATPTTVEALTSARSVAFLVGSYDGSGNFGDIAQLDAALALLAPLGPGLLALPVTEGALELDHRRAAAQMRNPPEHVLRFGSGEHDDGLVPVPPLSGLAYAACYLYGGGYLNPDWGDRKLAMLGAVESLAICGGAGRVDRIATGLQVDPDWLAGLAAADRRTLRSFAPLGGRDRRSSEALAELGAADATPDGGDDAIGLLAGPTPVAPGARGEALRVNLHFAEHGWVTGEPAAMLDFHREFLTEIGRLSGRRVEVQPLLAYVDSRIDEGLALARVTGACAGRGVEFLEPRLLRPADLDSATAAIAQGSFTLSCSYHAALVSLMLGIPAILLEDNAYYEQKAAGLRREFELPPELAARSAEDAGAVAARVLASVEGEAGAELRRRLTAAVGGAMERRARTETAVASRLAAGALAALANGGEEQAAKRRLAAAAERLAAAEQAAAEAHRRLSLVLGSRTWRLTEPLRRSGAALRRLRHR